MEGEAGRKGGKRTVPFWVKLLWFWPEVWVVVHEVNRELHCHSLRDCHSIDLNGLFSKTGGTVKKTKTKTNKQTNKQTTKKQTKNIYNIAWLLSGYTSPP